MDALIPFTTSGSLVDCVDKKMLVVLRDGRKLIGVLRSYDQFANFVLESTVERIHHKLTYADIPRGVFLIRGENVVLLGEVDLDLEDEVPLQRVPVDQIVAQETAEKATRKKVDTAREKILHKMGYTPEGLEGDAY